MTAIALRHVRWSDLPALKRMRSLPEVQKHLRHPRLSWPQHLRWWLRIRAHSDPTCRVWTVVREGKVIGCAGLYYRMGVGAEVSILVVKDGREAYATERAVIVVPLTHKAKQWGLKELWAEVLSTAPLQRHGVFPGRPFYADTHSTLYRWSIT